MHLRREDILPEADLPQASQIIARGRSAAQSLVFTPSRFLCESGFASEAAYKRAAMAEGRVMLHAQIGYRDLEKSKRAWAEIHNALTTAGGRVDRYGICLDWSMGYPEKERPGRPKGTGLILRAPEEWRALTEAGPVAPHFGDFVLGLPAALENTRAALFAGATSIGNLGQYFTFRLRDWDEDLITTEATLEALALIAARPEEILVHSNLDDGFAALFTDLASAFGAVLLEHYIVEELIGARVAHCYGHSFSAPLTRLAFQRALVSEVSTPGTMIYGNTLSYRGSGRENFAALATYLTVDLIAQRLAPSGHAINPVPITEALRIPDIDEVIEAQLFALRLMETSEPLTALLHQEEADRLAEKIVTGGKAFAKATLAGLALAGIDIENPFELLLTLRRLGGKRLEELFGQGEGSAKEPRGRRPIVKASTMAELEKRAWEAASSLAADEKKTVAEARLKVCIASSDVHEYGKMMAEALCRHLRVEVIDANVHAHPRRFAALALSNEADALTLSTYNGIALDYLLKLQEALGKADAKLPILIGGRLNQIDKASNSNLPRDVSNELRDAGALICVDMADLARNLLAIAKEKQR